MNYCHFHLTKNLYHLSLIIKKLAHNPFYFHLKNYQCFIFSRELLDENVLSRSKEYQV